VRFGSARLAVSRRPKEMTRWFAIGKSTSRRCSGFGQVRLQANAEAERPWRGTKPMGDTGDTALETATSRNGLISGEKPWSRLLRRSGADGGAWQRVASEVPLTSMWLREVTKNPLARRLRRLPCRRL
jgi:hypothetical protein